jgi:type VI secretion system protein ImpA
MASAEILDFAVLLQSISDETPGGENLRKDYSPEAVYRQIKDARNAARRAETRPSLDGEHNTDWNTVLDKGPEVIATQSKDLEIAAWITEALVRAHGFAGARDGFRLCRELIEQFWAVLHPEPDPDDPDDEEPVTVAALSGLNGVDGDGTLIEPLYRVSIVDADADVPLGVSAYQQAQALEEIDDQDERARRIEQGVTPIETFSQAIATTSAEWFAALREDLKQATDEFRKLCDVLSDKLGHLAPPSSNITSALAECAAKIDTIAGDAIPAYPTEEIAEGEGGETGEAASGGSGGGRPAVAGPIQTREQAFQRIREVAAFFRQTEPHSVLAWQLEECIKWGRMSLPELLSELIDDSGTRENVFRRVGIPLEDDSN